MLEKEVLLYLSDENFGKVYEKAFEKLYNDDNHNPWFDTKAEAEDWAGDILMDFMLNVFKELNIDCF